MPAGAPPQGSSPRPAAFSAAGHGLGVASSGCRSLAEWLISLMRSYQPHTWPSGAACTVWTFDVDAPAQHFGKFHAMYLVPRTDVTPKQPRQISRTCRSDYPRHVTTPHRQQRSADATEHGSVIADFCRQRLFLRRHLKSIDQPQTAPSGKRVVTRQGPVSGHPRLHFVQQQRYSN